MKPSAKHCVGSMVCAVSVAASQAALASGSLLGFYSMQSISN